MRVCERERVSMRVLRQLEERMWVLRVFSLGELTTLV